MMLMNYMGQYCQSAVPSICNEPVMDINAVEDSADMILESELLNQSAETRLDTLPKSLDSEHKGLESKATSSDVNAEDFVSSTSEIVTSRTEVMTVESCSGSPIMSAFVCCAAFKLEDACMHLEQPLNCFLFNQTLAQGLKNNLRR